MTRTRKIGKLLRGISEKESPKKYQSYKLLMMRVQVDLQRVNVFLFVISGLR